jgi:hypothetical protein
MRIVLAVGDSVGFDTLKMLVQPPRDHGTMRSERIPG